MRNDHTGSYTLEQLQHIACGQQQCKPMCAFCCWWAGQGFSRIALVSIRSTLIAHSQDVRCGALYTCVSSIEHVGNSTSVFTRVHTLQARCLCM